VTERQKMGEGQKKHKRVVHHHLQVLEHSKKPVVREDWHPQDIES
jgi:hypothetical protein